MFTGIVSTVECTKSKVEFPHDVAVDSDGNILIADASHSRIMYIEAATGELKLLHKERQGGWLRSVAISPEGYICYANSTRNWVRVSCGISSASTRNPPPLGQIELANARNVVTDDNGNIYVSNFDTLGVVPHNDKLRLYPFKLDTLSRLCYVNGSLIFGSSNRMYRLFVENEELIEINLENINNMVNINSIVYHDKMLYFSHDNRISKIDIIL